MDISETQVSVYYVRVCRHIINYLPRPTDKTNTFGARTIDLKTPGTRSFASRLVIFSDQLPLTFWLGWSDMFNCIVNCQL